MEEGCGTWYPSTGTYTLPGRHYSGSVRAPRHQHAARKSVTQHAGRCVAGARSQRIDETATIRFRKSGRYRTSKNRRGWIAFRSSPNLIGMSTDGSLDGWIARRMDRSTDGWLDGWICWLCLGSAGRVLDLLAGSWI